MWETRSESAHGHCLGGFVFKCATHGIRCSSAGGLKQCCIAAGAPFWIGGELPVFVVSRACERSGAGAERGAERSYFLWSGEHLLKISLRSLNTLSTARSTQKPFGMGGAREGLAGAQHPQEKPKHPHSTPIKN